MIKARLNQIIAEKIVFVSFTMLLAVSTIQVFFNVAKEKLADINDIPRSLSYAWILSGDSSGYFIFIFVLLLFPLTSLPLALTLEKERRNKFCNFYLIRSTRKSYIIALITANSLVVTVLTFSTLLWNLFLNSLFFPLLKPNEFMDYMRAYPLIPSQTLSRELFVHHPLLNIFMYILIAVLYSVIVSNFILLLGYFVNKPMYLFSLSVIMPFILLLLPIKSKLSPFIVLSVIAYNISPLSLGLFFCSCFIILISMYRYVIKRQE